MAMSHVAPRGGPAADDGPAEPEAVTEAAGSLLPATEAGPAAPSTNPASAPAALPDTSQDSETAADTIPPAEPEGTSPDAYSPSPPPPGEVAPADTSGTETSPDAANSGSPPPPPPDRTGTAWRDSEPEEEEEEEGGGPVKPFLDHLEDLRWTLLKVLAAVVLGMSVCLVAGNWLVAFLTWPLEHAQRMLPAAQQRVPLLLGTNEVKRVRVDSVPLPPSVNSNHITALELVPVLLGDRWVLTLNVQTNQRPDLPPENLVVLKNYGPLSAFVVALKIAFYGGLVVSAPFVIFFIGQFVLPALKVKEKMFVYRVAGYGSLLFILGVAFCYLVIMQVTLMASVQFSQWMGFGADEWRAEEYVSFVCKFMLGMGLSFQLPLVILTLVKMGIVDADMLANFRSYFIVGNLTLSAVITPSGDPFTMVLMALPLQVLYEGSILVARRWARKEREREAAEAAAGRG
jgi:sec-independent protein translocase protein TatC